MASSLSALLGASNGSGTTGAPNSSSASSALSSAPTEQMFLQLLVAQMQYQDPLNPTDSTQFVSQLAQFSELEQVIAIRTDIETAMANNANSSTATGSTPASGAGSSSSTPPTTPSTTSGSSTTNPS